MTLVWTRTQDGEHNGRPYYDYHATAGDRAYWITYADNAGFGISAYRRRPDGTNEDIGERHGIHWCRTLKNCKARAEQWERNHHVG